MASSSDSSYIDFHDYFNIGFDVVDRLGIDARNRLALVWIGADGRRETRTYWELSTASNRVANVLRARDIGARDVLLLLLPRTPQWWAVALGAIKRGAVIVIADPDIDAAALVRYAVATGACAVIADAAHAALGDAVRAELPAVREWMMTGREREGWASLDAACAATSGALLHMGFDEMTRPVDPMLYVPFIDDDGVERIALHAHGYALALGEMARTWYGIGPNDLHWTLAPVAWTSLSWCALFAEFMVGATAIVYESPAAIDPVAVLGLLSETGATSFCTTPALCRALVEAGMKSFDLSVLRECTCTGPVDGTTIENWKDGTEGLELRGGYGRSDIAVAAGIVHGTAAIPDAYGAALHPCHLELLDDAGTPLPADAVGRPGRLALAYDPRRPLGVPLRYVDPDQDAAAFSGDRFPIGTKAVRRADGILAPVAAPARNDGAIAYTIAPFGG